MWSKGEFKAILEAKALQRKGASGKAEEAALLYARWLGWTEEPDADQKAAEAQLNDLLDEMDDDDWDGLKKVAQDVGDATFKGVLTYAVTRMKQLNAEDLRKMENTKDWPQAPSPSRRDRDRS